MRIHKHISMALLFTFLCALLFPLTACGPGKGEKGGEEGHGGHGGHDEHGEEGEHQDIVLDDDQLKAAKVTSVIAKAGEIEEVLRLVARVSRNEDTLSHVNPRVGGIVRKIHKGLGEHVKTGEILVELDSVALGNTVGEFLKSRATTKAAEETLQKAKELFDHRSEALNKLLNGAIAVTTKIYEREKALQEKRISTLRPFLDAEKAVQMARLNKERQLAAFKSERDTRILELEVALRQARIEEVADRDRLRVLELSDEEIQDFSTGANKHYGRFVIRAPRDGIVVKRDITMDEYVDNNMVLFEIYDLSRLWVLASIYEKDLTAARTGQKAIVNLDAIPNVGLPGTVTLVGYTVSEQTRTVDIRVELENKPIDSWAEKFPIRPGMFGSVELVTNTRMGRVVVPEAAVVHEGEENFIFVQEDEHTFERKEVVLKKGARGLVEILSGVDPGDRIAVTGTFFLKSMARRSELGGGHSH